MMTGHLAGELERRRRLPGRCAFTASRMQIVLYDATEFGVGSMPNAAKNQIMRLKFSLGGDPDRSGLKPLSCLEVDT